MTTAEYVFAAITITVTCFAAAYGFVHICLTLWTEYYINRLK